jgi:hypothetical protein
MHVADVWSHAHLRSRTDFAALTHRMAALAYIRLVSITSWLCNVVVHEPGCAKGCYVFCHGLLTVSLKERSQCVIIERFQPYTSF